MAAKNQRASSVRGGDYSVVVGGDVQNSNVVNGKSNKTSMEISKVVDVFEFINRAVDRDPTLKPDEKQDVKAELEEIQSELKEPEPDETFLARRFRNLKRMSPDIVEVAIETLKNPISGVAEVVKRIAKKMAEDANA